MILMTKSCKQYDLQIKDLNNSPDWLQFYENNTETMNYIGENTGSNFTKSNLLDALQTIFYYYKDLTIEVNFHNKLSVLHNILTYLFIFN